MEKFNPGFKIFANTPLPPLMYNFNLSKIKNNNTPKKGVVILIKKETFSLFEISKINFDKEQRLVLINLKNKSIINLLEVYILLQKVKKKMKNSLEK